MWLSFSKDESAMCLQALIQSVGLAKHCLYVRETLFDTLLLHIQAESSEVICGDCNIAQPLPTFAHMFQAVRAQACMFVKVMIESADRE